MEKARKRLLVYIAKTERPYTHTLERERELIYTLKWERKHTHTHWREREGVYIHFQLAETVQVN